jgi:5-methylcytosine-specific restriction endonuclease McrA
MLRTLVLDMGHQPHRIVSWSRAMALLLCRNRMCGDLSCHRHPLEAKAVVVSTYDARVTSERMVVQLPAVIKLQVPVPYVKRVVRYNRINVFLRDRFTCAYDGKRYPERMLTLDHVIPRARWKGPIDELTTWTNVVTACKPCNLRKGARTPKDAGMKLLFKPHVPEHLPPLPLRLPEGAIPEAWAEWLAMEVQAAS